jgi:hypothetical protein
MTHLARVFTGFCLAAISCAPAAKPPPPPVEEAFVLDSREDPKAMKDPLTSSAGSTKTAQITFLPNKVRAPAVRGTVHGKQTWMLIDTGASRHFIASWMIRRIFSDDIGQNATDHIGRTIKTSRLEEPQMKLDGFGAVPDTVAMIISQGDESSDLGVTMSPQQLVSSGGALVLDFPNKTMTMMGARDSAERSLPKGAALTPAQKCGGVFFVAAKVGDANATMLVDTGAWASDLKPNSAAARSLTMQTKGGQDRGYGAGGVINSRRLPNVPVSVGAVRTSLDIQLLDDSTETGACRSDGVIGMDLLQSCVLVVDNNSITGRCGS